MFTVLNSVHHLLHNNTQPLLSFRGHTAHFTWFPWSVTISRDTSEVQILRWKTINAYCGWFQTKILQFGWNVGYAFLWRVCWYWDWTHSFFHVHYQENALDKHLIEWSLTLAYFSKKLSFVRSVLKKRKLLKVWVEVWSDGIKQICATCWHFWSGYF